MSVDCDCHLPAYSLDDEAGAHRTPAGTYEGNTPVVTQQQARPAVKAVALSRGRSAQAGRAVKAVADRVLAALLLILALPILLAAALLVELTDPGPLFHRQTRIGRDGVEFRMWKLRTMRTTNRAGHAQSSKQPSDPRVTRAGRLLRRSSVDELPQLLNVLTGSMSLVGPRPWLPGELPATASFLSVRPGMTGLWQVSGRSELDAAARIALDVTYVETWSLAGDARILLRTIPAVLGARGAY